MIGPDLEGPIWKAGSQQLTASYDAAFENLPGSQGNKPGDDHDPRYRRDATSASPAAVRSSTHGGHRKITQYMGQQLPEQSGGGCSGI